MLWVYVLGGLGVVTLIVIIVLVVISVRSQRKIKQDVQQQRITGLAPLWGVRTGKKKVSSEMTVGRKVTNGVLRETPGFEPEEHGPMRISKESIGFGLQD